MSNRDERSATEHVGGRHVVLASDHAAAAGDDARVVHLLALPFEGEGEGEGGAASAMCGQQIPADRIETTVPEKVGCWCQTCLIVHTTGDPPAPAATSATSAEGRASAVTDYRKLGWPLLLHDEGVYLALQSLDAVALVLPALLSTEVTDILVRRRCAPAVLVHPQLPAHRVILASDPYSVPLGWPTGVHRIDDALMLPPTLTARGPALWVRPPEPTAPRLCREFDVFAALHTALQ